MTADARLRVAVAGASGRMGRMLIEAIGAADDLVQHTLERALARVAPAAASTATTLTTTALFMD